MAIFLAGKAVCYRILAFFCYGKLHFKCESADLLFRFRLSFCRSGKLVWRKRVGVHVRDLYLIQKSDLPKLHSISV